MIRQRTPLACSAAVFTDVCVVSLSGIKYQYARNARGPCIISIYEETTSETKTILMMLICSILNIVLVFCLSILS